MTDPLDDDDGERAFRDSDFKSIKASMAAARKSMNAYATRIGHVAIRWNAVQDLLSEAFEQILQSKLPGVGMSIWNSLKSDRTQRETLSVTLRIFKNSSENKPLANEIEWILDQMNNLSHKRNDAIHSPFTFELQNSGWFTVVPGTMRGNPQAEKMAKNDILPWLRWVEASLSALEDHLAKLVIYTRQQQDGPLALPQRPLLQPLSQFQTPTPKRRRTAPKPPRRRRAPSQV